MSSKAIEDVYRKILKDKLKHTSSSNVIRYTNSDGIETETVFRTSPTPDELEGLLLWLNKEKLANA
jgi:hypothetical protein